MTESVVVVVFLFLLKCTFQPEYKMAVSLLARCDSRNECLLQVVMMKIVMLLAWLIVVLIIEVLVSGGH